MHLYVKSIFKKYLKVKIMKYTKEISEVCDAVTYQLWFTKLHLHELTFVMVKPLSDCADFGFTFFYFLDDIVWSVLDRVQPQWPRNSASSPSQSPEHRGP